MNMNACLITYDLTKISSQIAACLLHHQLAHAVDERPAGAAESSAQHGCGIVDFLLLLVAMPGAPSSVLAPSTIVWNTQPLPTSGRGADMLAT